MDDLTREFLIESQEAVDELDNDLIVLDETPDDKATIDRVFRALLTIKGVAGCLGFETLEGVTHHAENLLMQVRDGYRPLTGAILGVLFDVIDAIRVMLGTIEATESDAGDPYTSLIERMERLASAVDTSGPPPPPESASEATSSPASAPAVAEASAEAPAAAPSEAASDIWDTEIVETSERPVPSTVPVKAMTRPVVEATGDTVANRDAEEEEAPVEALATLPGTATIAMQGVQAGSSRVGDATIRVSVDLLEKIMNQVGELVLCRNQITQATTSAHDREFIATSQRLNLITAELQESVMKTRMQPIGALWNKLPRAVRDISRLCGKQVRLEVEDAETELDKTLIEAIKDPMTHLVRNAIDHGIESPEARIAKGKPPEGVLRMRAYHEDGQVTIAISDDGKGIDADRIRQKAIQNGVISPRQANEMDSEHLIQLIFHPGLSTADQVTHVSGRGVGMDVVRTNIEEINGTIDLQSELGQGTTVLLRIPLTLAIIPGLVVTCDGDRCVLPQAGLLELVRLEGRRADATIEYVHDVPVYRLRGKLLPLVFLADELGLRDSDPRSMAPDAVVNICVVQAKGRQYGLVVDDVIDTQEIVVKPISRILKQIPAYSGATILGDGSVALILDMVGLAMDASVLDKQAASASDGTLMFWNEEEEPDWLLLATTQTHARVAIPLSRVARLEEFELARVEWAGEQPVVQYRGAILRLLDLATILPGRSHPTPLETRLQGASSLHAIVVVHEDNAIGLVVESILDIVQDAATVERQGARPGVRGTAVIQDKVTELLDVDAILAQHAPSFFQAAYAAAG
jgi:two-component system, chemotaxis family, sensor kinase CheA